MFSECYNLTILNINSFDTSNVINMSYMFYNCYSLESIYLNNFDTSSVIDMGYMFFNCNSLKSLNLKNFHTSSTTNINSMINFTNENSIFCFNSYEEYLFKPFLLSSLVTDSNNSCLINILFMILN